ncbi:DUF3089 domain-containing protein [Xanthomonas arboricola]|uniref:DUF3089 domain-containing protein n=1 Tax=Xanthomonas arboricola TaxID=56448 RepID=UPI0009BA661B|nr:DUF3089 domain-containing protein [Xanthomonas arboricola]
MYNHASVNYLRIWEMLFKVAANVAGLYELIFRRRIKKYGIVVGIAAPLFSGCVSTHTPENPKSALNTYANSARWLCLPGREDACATPRVIFERFVGEPPRSVADAAPVSDPGLDCFYVYPTVSMSPIPRNADNFNYNHENIETVAKVQAASFRSACRIFAPYYRQATIATYILPEHIRQTYVRVALNDVEAAFDYYMSHDNGGRKIVLIGHSQGAELVKRLLQDRFDTFPTMRKKLALAIIAGAPVYVPAGSTRGGTFENIATCSSPGEVGCYITYKSYIEGTHPEPERRMVGRPGEEEACVNPATLDIPGLSPEARRDERRKLGGTLLPPPAWSLGGVEGDKTMRSFERVHDGYSAACYSEPGTSLRFLSIREELAPGDQRRPRVPFDSRKLRNGLGLHVLDMQFPSEELVSLVRARQPG